MARRSGPRKSAAFDGAVGRGGPFDPSCRRMWESQLTEAVESMNETSEARQRPSLPADNAGTRERRSEGPGSGALRDERGSALGKPRVISGSSPKLEARRQAGLHSMHALRQGFGRAGRMEAAEGGGDSRTERSVGCSFHRSVAHVGTDASSPREAKRAERLAAPASGSA